MKKLLAMMAVAALGGGTAMADLLTNSDLELGIDDNDATGWTLVEPDVDGAGAPTNSAQFIGFANHETGGARGLWFRSFEGGLGGDEPSMVNADLYQDVAGNAGENYALSAWFLFETNYTAAGTVLAMDFLDGSNAVLGSATTDVETVVTRGAGWTEVSVSGLAPAGTVSVRARASFIDGTLNALNPQSAFVDDFNLVPEPTTALMLLVPAFLLRRRG